MIDITQLEPGNTVRHVESGRAYIVTAVHSMTRRVFAIREIEISNPDEWILIPPPRKKWDRATVDKESLIP